MNKELQEELIRFVNSVAKDENWYGERNNEWFAKRHCKQWAEAIKKKLLEQNLDVIP